MMKDLTLIVGHNLTSLRKARGLTQGEIASKFSYTDKSISKWEHGEAIPDLQTLMELANFYGVSLDYLAHEQSDASLAENGKTDPVAQRTNKIVLSALAVIFVWTVAAVFYAGLTLIPQGYLPWMAFVWAVPGSFLALVYFSHKWGRPSWSLAFELCFVWMAAFAAYLEIVNDLRPIGWNYWFVLLVGVPLTVALVFAHRIKKE